MADIIAELQIIKNGVYGKDIRMAIHDAIQKVNEDGGGGGGVLQVNTATIAAYDHIVGNTPIEAFMPNNGGD